MKYFFVTGDLLDMCFNRSRSFKVIDFCTDRKPIYDFLLAVYFTVFEINTETMKVDVIDFRLANNGYVLRIQKRLL